MSLPVSFVQRELGFHPDSPESEKNGLEFLRKAGIVIVSKEGQEDKVDCKASKVDSSAATTRTLM